MPSSSSFPHYRSLSSEYSPVAQSPQHAYQDNTSYHNRTSSPLLHPRNRQNVRQLSKQDPEYSAVEFQLRQSLNSVSASVLRMFSIASPRQTSELGISAEITQANAWINVDAQLPQTGKNSVDFLIEEGRFVFGKNGSMILVCGDIREHILGLHLPQRDMYGEVIDQNGITGSSSFGAKPITQFIQDEGNRTLQERDTEGHQVYTLLLCGVDLGTCFTTEETDEPVILPSGYDSVHIEPSGDKQSDVYCHRYAVFEDRRIYPKYIVIVDYDLQGDESWKSDNMQRVESGRAPSYHESIINNAYNQSIEALRSGDTPDNAREQSQIYQMQERLRAIEERRQDVVETAKLTEQRLRDMFQDALSSLRDQTQLKLSALLSMEVELRKKGEEMEWMDEFIHYVKNMNIAPVNFLEYYTQFCALKKQRLSTVEQYTMREIDRGLDHTLADTNIEGQVAVRSSSHSTDSDFQRTVLLRHNPSPTDQEYEALPTILENDFSAQNNDLKKKDCVIQ